MILRWYKKNRRSLRWRSTRDPYEILVSEVMLQQTQVSRVRVKLPQFLDTFPNLHALAEASAADVIRAWRGMGYNNRALRLRDTARIIVQRYGGTIPRDPDHLRTLPGIGRYTAAAVACFAFRAHVAVVDVNVRRVLSRIFWTMPSLTGLRSEAEIRRLAESVLPGNSYAWNQALMDLGATICTARRTHCEPCPTVISCRSHHLSARRRHAGRERAQGRREEPSYEGIPQRIWRGRIIEQLRQINGRGSIPLCELGRRVKRDFRSKELHWLETLAFRLEKDRLVELRRTRGVIRVSLATA